MDKDTRKKVVEFLAEHRPSVEKIRVCGSEIHAYGPVPNTNQEGWYFLCYSDEIEVKGLNCLL